MGCYLQNRMFQAERAGAAPAVNHRYRQYRRKTACSPQNRQYVISHAH